MATWSPKHTTMRWPGFLESCLRQTATEFGERAESATGPGLGVGRGLAGHIAVSPFEKRSLWISRLAKAMAFVPSDDLALFLMDRPERNLN